MAELIRQKKRLMLFGEGSENWGKENCLTPLSEEERQNGLYAAAKRQKGLSGAWEKEPLLAVPAREKAAPFDAGSENWEKQYSYEEKRLKSLVDGEGYDKWEKENQLWEIQNHLVPIAEEWEKQYSYEEKRLKSLVDGEGYDKWEKKNRLWEIQNYLVPLAEEVSYEEEKRQKDLAAEKQRRKEILLVLSSLSLEDEKKGEEAYRKRLEELRTKPLTKEENLLKELYLENMEKARLGLDSAFEPGWDLGYFWDKPNFPPVKLVLLDEMPTVPLTPELRLFKKKQSPLDEMPTVPLTPELRLFKKKQPAEGFSDVSTNREEKREKNAAEGRCLGGLYLTPYCKCNTQCCGLKKPLEEHPPEITPIWLAYCRQCRQSHYFDIDDYPGYRFGAGVMPLEQSQDFNGEAELLMKLANRAILEYNQKECNIFKYKVLKIEKVNYSVAMYDTYWMTVKVLNLTLGTPIETFQIHAGICEIIDDEVIYCCRPKEEAIIGLPSCEFCFGLLPERRVTGGTDP